VNLVFPEDFPNNPPEIIFKSNISHPNINDDGKLQLKILFKSSKSDERWIPQHGIKRIL